MPKAEYDEQGLKFWSLLSEAGWTEERIEALIWKRYKCSHWMACNESQRKGLMATAQSYAKKANSVQRTGNRAEQKKAAEAKMKMLRQNIMAIVSANGLDRDWLHSCMVSWGFGDSLRKLGYKQLWQVKSSVLECFKGRKRV